MIKPVYKYEGTVARLMGDGLLAFFGTPIAHEDDPQRAVLAGLDIVGGISPYRQQVVEGWGIDFDVRVGINTGLVVVGAVGSDLRMEYSAMGDAINMAARMEQTAKPGTVQIAHDTYNLVKPLFEFEELGGLRVKGKVEPVLAYRVLSRKAMTGQKRGIEGLQAEIVGRDLELATLRKILSGVQQGVGRIVCVIGQAGLGKSRLIKEARQSLALSTSLTSNKVHESSIPDPQPPIPSLQWFESASLSYESNQPYGLFQRLIRRLHGIGPGDPAGVVWDKTAPLLDLFEDGDRQRASRVLEALFDLNGDGQQPRLEGEDFKRELYTMMPIVWRQRFSQQPSVIAFDDLHWSDPASIDLLLHLFPLTAEIPLVILCAFRPDRRDAVWRIKTIADEEFHHRYTEINLRPLSDRQVDELVNRLLTIADLPGKLRTRILERAGGNPFFVEEVVRSLIDSGSVIAQEREEDGHPRLYWQATGDGEQIDIPDNLQALLTSRIDRLEDETRRILQMAAVIGRSFYKRVLESIGEQDERSVADIERQLSLLLRLEIIQEAARIPELEYKFSNPLTQEVTYQTILLKRRRDFHHRVGLAVEALFPRQLSEFAPYLAYHFQEGGDDERALHYYTQAGDNARRLYANNEAIAHYDKALEIARRIQAAGEHFTHLVLCRGRTLEHMGAEDQALAGYEENKQSFLNRPDVRNLYQKLTVTSNKPVTSNK